LEYIGRASEHGGARVTINDSLDYPTFAARNPDEYHWLRRAVLDQRLVEIDGDGFTLTVQGWDAFRPGHGGVPGTCFVAMAFDSSLDDAYSLGIQPAV
jgi:hypothetical protein